MVKTEQGDDTEQKVKTLVEGIFDAVKSAHELSERTDPIEKDFIALCKLIDENFDASVDEHAGDLQGSFLELKTAIQEHEEVLEGLKKLILSNKAHRNEHLQEVVKKRKTH